MSKRQICVNLEKSLVDRIDQVAGDVPRSRVIERALYLQLGDKSPLEKNGEMP